MEWCGAVILVWFFDENPTRTAKCGFSQFKNRTAGFRYGSVFAVRILRFTDCGAVPAHP